MGRSGTGFSSFSEAKAEKKKDAKARRIARAKVAPGAFRFHPGGLRGLIRPSLWRPSYVKRSEDIVFFPPKLEEMLQRQRQKQEEAELMHSQLGRHMRIPWPLRGVRPSWHVKKRARDVRRR